MDLIKTKKLKSICAKLVENLEKVEYTTEFLNPSRPQIKKLCAGLSISDESELLNTKLKQFYIKEQSNSELEYLTILSGYLSGNYKEALFLAQDLLTAQKTPEVYFIILKLCINKLSLADMALHYSFVSLEHNPGNDLLIAARAVACIYNSVITAYQINKTKLLEEAKNLFVITSSNGRNILFFKGYVHASLGNLNEALVYSSEGLKNTMEPNYIALVALIMLGQEDFTGALAVIKRGLKGNPCNLLLYGVK